MGLHPDIPRRTQIERGADGRRYELSRIRLADGSETTVYVAVHPRESTRVRVACFAEAARLDHWCAAAGQPEARSCVHVEPDGMVTVAARGEIAAAPAGDLVQAGPRLVVDGEVVVSDEDPEGFSAAAGQFDSDITAERHPRCALGLNEDELFAVCCDGRRTGVDAGLDLPELARLLLSLGAADAINLDGGGSATLVHRGHLLNRPYSSVDQPGPESRPVVTALLFE